MKWRGIPAIPRMKDTTLYGTLTSLKDNVERLIKMVDPDTKGDSNTPNLSEQITAVSRSSRNGLADVRTSITAQVTDTEALASRTTELETAVDDPTTGLEAAHARITAEEIARASEVAAVAASVTALDATVNDPVTGLPKAHSLITESNLVRAAAIEAMAERVTNVESALTTELTEANARIAAVETTRATETYALAQKVEVVEASYTSADATLTARIATEEIARASGDSANATSINSVSSRLDNFDSSGSTVEARVSTVSSTAVTASNNATTALARYAVKLDVNGYTTGWEANNNGSSGEMIFRTDTFRVGQPGSSSIYPFEIVGSDVKIKNAHVGTIQSDGFVSGSTGWRIMKDGSAEFNGVVISRDLVLGTGVANVGPYGPVSGSAGTVIIDTGVAVSAWDATTGPLSCNLGFENTEVVTLVGDEPVTYWEVRPKSVFGRNRYTGAATLCIEAEIVGHWYGLSFAGSGGATAAQVRWRLYDVT